MKNLAIYWFLTVFLLGTLPLVAQTSTKDSLLQALHNHPQADSLRVHALLQLAKYELRHVTQNATPLLKEAFYIAKKKQNANQMAEVYALRGLLYMRLNQYDSSQMAYNRAISIYKKLNDLRGLAKVYCRLSINQRRKSNYTASLKTVLKARKLYDMLGDIRGQATLHNYIAMIYSQLNLPDKALKFHFKALHIHREIKDTLGEAYTLGDIAYGYFLKKDYPKAMRFSQESVTKSIQMKQKPAKFWAMGLQGLVHIKQARPQKGIEMLREVVDAFQQLGIGYLKTFFNTYLSITLVAEQQYEEAQRGLTKSWVEAKKHNWGKLRVRSLSGLYKLHKHQGNPAQALYYQERYIQVKDSIYNRNKTHEIATMQLSFEIEKERELSKQMLAKKQLELNNKSLVLKQRNTLLYASVLIVLLLAVIVLYVFKSRQKQIKFNQTLARQNKEITEKKEEITQQAEKLRMAHDKLLVLDKFKEQMTGMIVHDLKNPLNTIIGLTGKKFTPHFQKAIHQSGIRMLNLVLNILDVQRFEEAKIKLRRKPLSLKRIIQRAQEQVSLALAEKSILFRQDVTEDVVVEVDEELTIRVFVNLLHNAIKYTPAQGKVTIRLEGNDQKTEPYQKVIIEDTGVGIPQDFIPHIFDKYSQYAFQKVGNPHSSGLGLTFCKQTIEAHGGSIGVESSVDQGSIFWITLPFVAFDATSTTSRIELANAPPGAINNALITLDAAEKKLLSPYIKQLQKLEIYELTAIKNILEQIPTKSIPLKEWKKEVEGTMYSWNEHKYKKLLKLFDNLTIE